MSQTRLIEVFSAGCEVCTAFIERVREEACGSCEVIVRDMHDPEIARRAAALGVASLPAVAVNGALADCCDARGPSIPLLRAAGLGQAL